MGKGPAIPHWRGAPKRSILNMVNVMFLLLILTGYLHYLQAKKNIYKKIPTYLPRIEALAGLVPETQNRQTL